MPKRNKRDGKVATEARGADDAPFNSAFADLANLAGLAALPGLRDALPSAECAPPPTHTEPSEVKPASTTKRVVLQRERKGRAGKTVTRVLGLSGELEPWAARLKKALGCGASVERGEVVLLGDVGDAAARLFEAEHIRVVRGG